MVKVIGAGNGRTGTLSMKLALEQLGFGPCYHMYELMSEPERLPHWQNAFAGEAVDWATLFDRYQSTMDYPGFYFYDQILGAYPEAKVILTVRPADEWYESAKRTIYRAAPSPTQKLRILTRLPFSPQLRKALPVFKLADYMWDVIFEGRFEDRAYATNRFEEMNQAVIDTVPSNQLLVFNVGDGWEQLCGFLNVAEPTEPFPKTNQRSQFDELIKATRRGEMPMDRIRGSRP